MADMMPVTEMVQRVQEILTDVRNETWDSHDFTAQDADALAGLLRVVAMVGKLPSYHVVAPRMTEDGALWHCLWCGIDWPKDDEHPRNGCLELIRQALHETTGEAK